MSESSPNQGSTPAGADVQRCLFRGGFLNVEPSRKHRLRPRSGVVADTPPGSLVHLSKTSGPVRHSFSNLCLFAGCFVACRGAVGGSGVGWEGLGPPV